MHLGTFRAGMRIPLTQVFQDAEGADISAENPTVEVIYIDSAGQVQTLLPPTPMQKRSQNQAGDYFYLFSIPDGTPPVRCFVNYRATVSGINTTAEDSFSVSVPGSGGEEGEELIQVVGSAHNLHVRDSRGNPLANVQVTVYDRERGRAIAQTMTDANGDFLIYIPPGRYIFRYTKENWLSAIAERGFE